MPRLASCSSIACVLLLLTPANARAATCPVPSGGSDSLAATDAAVRLEFIHQTLRDDQGAAQAWRTGWLVVLTVVDAAELSFAIAGTVTPNPPEGPGDSFRRFAVNLLREGRYGFYAGSITAAGGVGSVLLRTSRTAFDGDRVDLLVRNAQPGQDCAVLAAAEAFLRRDAHDEALAHGVIPHVVTGAASLATLLVIGLVFHRWPGAALNAGLGVAGGELLIATEPTKAVTALDRYRRGDLSIQTPPAVRVELSPAGLALRF
jgi:hypothetical protein